MGMREFNWKVTHCHLLQQNSTLEFISIILIENPYSCWTPHINPDIETTNCVGITDQNTGFNIQSV